MELEARKLGTYNLSLIFYINFSHIITFLAKNRKTKTTNTTGMGYISHLLSNIDKLTKNRNSKYIPQNGH